MQQQPEPTTTPFSSALAKWSVAGIPNDNVDYRVFAKAAEIIKKHVVDKAKGLVASAAHRPILFTYASDGTPVRATGTFTSTLGGSAAAGAIGAKLKRRGGDPNELLVERGYIVSRDAIGRITSTPLLRDARPLAKGKDHWRMFIAATQFFPHLRMLGHKSICLTHCCFDRMAYSSMSRVLGQRQAAYYQVKYGEQAGVGLAKNEEDEDWFLHTACAAHDCQNALNWGQTVCVEDAPTAVEGLYIGLSALRNSYTLLFSVLSGFIRDHLQFATHDLPDETTLSTMWGELGLKPKVADELAALGLLFEQDKLWVRPSLEGTEDVFGRVHGALVAVMKFRKFTQSR